MRVGDLPVVFLSYDEPWADVLWEDLRQKAPNPVRVHGVKGLDASHKAAAKAAGARWFVTVDADTSVDPTFFDLEFDDDLLCDQFRLDWFSRNAVNGLVSGNGCLKIWPSELARRMRTHEAAPEGRVSLDHDIAQILPARSMQVQMPGCYSTTNPAGTPYHGFRAGFREAVFLASLGTIGETDAPRMADEAAWYLKVWCSIGRHARNGIWVLYGARLGLWLWSSRPDWNVQRVNDYAWFSTFWAQSVVPRFRRAGHASFDQDAWDEPHLLAEISSLGDRIAGHLELEIAELSAEESRLVAEAGLFPAANSGKSLDGLGRVFLKGRGVPRNDTKARSLFETAAAMGHPAAFNNLARIHERSELPDASRDEAERLYEAAIALGNRHAPYHLGRMLQAEGIESARAESLIRLAAERGYGPASREGTP